MSKSRYRVVKVNNPPIYSRYDDKWHDNIVFYVEYRSWFSWRMLKAYNHRDVWFNNEEGALKFIGVLNRVGHIEYIYPRERK